MEDVKKQVKFKYWIFIFTRIRKDKEVNRVVLMTDLDAQKVFKQAKKYEADNGMVIADMRRV